MRARTVEIYFDEEEVVAMVNKEKMRSDLKFLRLLVSFHTTILNQNATRSFHPRRPCCTGRNTRRHSAAFTWIRIPIHVQQNYLHVERLNGSVSTMDRQIVCDTYA